MPTGHPCKIYLCSTESQFLTVFSWFGLLGKLAVRGLSKSTSAVSKSAMCELRSATAGAINASWSLRKQIQNHQFQLIFHIS